MTNLSDTNKYYRTSDATAEVADITNGKIAYAADGKLIGTNPGNLNGDDYGVILDYKMPIGSSSSSYTRSLADAAMADPNLSIVGSHEMHLDTNGYVWSKTGESYRQIINAASPGAIPARNGCRRYQFTGKTKDANPTNFTGIGIRFNQLNTSNYWRLRFASGSSDEFYLYLEENVAGSLNLRATISFDSAINWPARFQVDIWDFGDYIVCSGTVWESDSQEHDTKSIEYYAASRNHKDEEAFQFEWIGVTYDEWLVRSLAVWDEG